MKRLLLAVLLTTGCRSSSPFAPPPPDPPPNMTPASIALTLASRPDFQTNVTATVYSVDRHRVANLPVAFSTAAGTVTPAQAVTDANGTATAVVNSAQTTTVSATIGGAIAASIDVAGVASPGIITSPPPVIFPDPPTGTPFATLNVAARGATGAAIVFSVAAPTGHAWTWTFGDGTSAQTIAYTTTHTYATAGTYDATVSSPGVLSGRATIVISDAPPVVTPPPALSAVLTCTPAAHGSPSPCNVAVSYGGTPLPAATITGVAWDWGDGSTSMTTTPVATRTYVNAGTYTVFATVTATTVDGAKTTTVTKSIVVP